MKIIKVWVGDDKMTIDERKAVAQNFINALVAETNNEKIGRLCKIWANSTNVRIYGLDDRNGYISIDDSGKVSSKLNGAKSISGEIWAAMEKVNR